MTAMIRPIGIDHSYFCNSGISALVSEILLKEEYIRIVHCKSVTYKEVVKSCGVKLAKSLKHFNVCRLVGGTVKAVHSLKRRLTALNGVNNVLLHTGKDLVGDLSRQNIHLGGAHRGSVAL